MNPTDNVSPINAQFSQCSQVTICSKNQVFASCLQGIFSISVAELAVSGPKEGGRGGVN
jgi:hypothetical protein